MEMANYVRCFVDLPSCFFGRFNAKFSEIGRRAQNDDLSYAAVGIITKDYELVAAAATRFGNARLSVTGIKHADYSNASATESARLFPFRVNKKLLFDF